MLDTGLRAADARFAMLVEELKRDREDRARDHAALVEEMRRAHAALRRDMKRDKADLRKEIRHMSTQLQLRGSLAVGGGVLATVTILQFLLDAG